MAGVVRGLLLAALFLVLPHPLSGQAPGILHIKIVVLDAERKPTGVSRHALLISDEPVSAPPRRVITGLDGTVDVRLRPGRYIVESDQPVAVSGRGYVWTKIVDVPAGGEVALELRDDNAEVVPVASARSDAPDPVKADPLSTVPRWKNSLVGLWTPKARASGFIVDTRGFVVTSQRAIGNVTNLEVQLAPSIKVEGRVVAADASRDVAIVWIDSALASGVPPVPLGCSQSAMRVSDGQEIVALGLPLGGKAELASGGVSRTGAREIAADLRLAPGSAGGPVFTAEGTLIGLTSFDQPHERERGELRVIPIEDACEVLRLAEEKMRNTTGPGGTQLPVESSTPFPPAALAAAFSRHGADLSPYRMAWSDFDVAFITPIMMYAARQNDRHTTSQDMRQPQMDQMRIPQWAEFANWSDYVVSFPPVVLVRVTPKLSESFWTTVARGAAMTQGMPLPAIKRFKSAFGRMRLMCGEADVTPIHPFVLESPVASGETVIEGLYAFDPRSFGPECGTVKLALYSEKEPQHADTRTVDPAVLKQIWRDFAPHRLPEN